MLDVAWNAVNQAFSNAFAAAQTAIFVDIVQPVFYRLDLMEYIDDAYDGVEFFLVGVLQIGLMVLLLRPLEALRPVEQWDNRKAVRVDVLYTLIHRLGLFNLVFFFMLQPWFDALQEWLRLRGVVNINLETLWPGVTSQPLVSFLIYLVVLDFAGYWYHRWQHRFGWWWDLHSLHHSQRQLSLWADDRNHLLDDVLQNAFFAIIALAVGVAPAQFVVLVAVSQFAQSVQHANARLPFGWLERVVVSPAFHRRHHAIGVGHEGVYRGCNFGVLFPWWDMLFGTADFSAQLEPTGIRDQLAPPLGRQRNYGSGFWAQQWLGLVRIVQRVTKNIGDERNTARAR